MKASCTGVRRGDFHITYDLIGNVFRASSAGSTPRNNYFIDMFYATIGYVSVVNQEMYWCTGLLLHRSLCRSGDGAWIQLFDNTVENTTSICRAVGSSSRYIIACFSVI